MNALDRPNAGSEDRDVPTVEISTLRQILHQSTPTPQSHFHRRLRESDGRSWFLQRVAGALTELGFEGSFRDSFGEREALKALKRAGKRRLRDARSADQIEEAALLYFGGVFGLLADQQTSSISEITGLESAIVEDSIQVIGETLGEEWSDQFASAERFFD